MKNATLLFITAICFLTQVSAKDLMLNRRLNALVQQEGVANIDFNSISADSVKKFIKESYLTEQTATAIFKSARTLKAYEYDLDQWAQTKMKDGLREYLLIKLIEKEMKQPAVIKNNVDLAKLYAGKADKIQAVVDAKVLSVIKNLAKSEDAKPSDDLKQQYGAMLKANSFPHASTDTDMDIYKRWEQLQRNIATFGVEKSILKSYVATKANMHDLGLGVKVSEYRSFVKEQRSKALATFAGKSMSEADVEVKRKLDPEMTMVIKDIKILSLKNMTIAEFEKTAPEKFELEKSRALKNLAEIFDAAKLNRYFQYESLAEQLKNKYNANASEIKQQKAINEQSYLDSGEFKYFMITRILELAAFLADNKQVDLNAEREILKQELATEFPKVLNALDHSNILSAEEKSVRFGDLFLSKIKKMGDGKSAYRSKVYQMISHAASFEIKQLMEESKGEIILTQEPANDKEMKKKIVAYLKDKLMNQRIEKYFNSTIKNLATVSQLKLKLDNGKLLQDHEAYQHILGDGYKWWF